MDPCCRCDRADCPTLGMGGYESVSNELDTLIYDSPRHLSGEQEAIRGCAVKRLKRARTDCDNHAVDWRSETLKLRAAVMALPEYEHDHSVGYMTPCPTWEDPRESCNCGADAANTARAALRAAVLALPEVRHTTLCANHVRQGIPCHCGADAANSARAAALKLCK